MLLVAVLLGVYSTAANIVAHPEFKMDDCLRGQELALTRDYLEGRRSPQALFLSWDEAVYVRAAQKMSEGKVATDYLGDFVEQVRTSEKDDGLYAISADYRLAYRSREFLTPGKPSFVSYRSMVFPAWGVPVMLAVGCTTQGLAALRWSMLPWRVASIVAAGLLAFALARRRQVLALSLASLLVAADAQLSDAGSYFLTDVPGAALLLLWLWCLTRLCLRPSLRFGVLQGLFMGFAVLVKADLMYVLPVSLLLAPLAVLPERRAIIFKCVMLASAAYVLVLGAWAIRNHSHTNAWFITSKDSVNLYLGNSPDAPARHYRYGVSAAEQANIDLMPVTRQAQLRDHGPEVALRIHFQELAMAELRADPLGVARMFKDRLIIFLKSGGFVHFPWLGQYSHALSLLIMSAALLGSAWAGWGRWRSAKPMLGAGVAFLASLAIVSMVYFEARYISHIFALACVITSVYLAQLPWLPRDRLRDEKS
ncbi:MAG: hypothetical protein ABIR35_08695 [Polaromonas sp.]